MELPCEEFAKKYMPSVRARIVRGLHDRYGLTQVEISKILGITQPAVSQYLKGIRGRGVKLPEKTNKIIDEQTEKIYEMYRRGGVNRKALVEIYCVICRSIMGS